MKSFSTRWNFLSERIVRLVGKSTGGRERMLGSTKNTPTRRLGIKVSSASAGSVRDHADESSGADDAAMPWE
jgi:hypothetical protein